MLSLQSILPTLPAEAVAWLNTLDAPRYAATERILNIVGEHSFRRYWRDYRDDWRKLEQFAR